MELTTANFDTTIQSSTVTLVDFWAPWCGPCKMMAPVIDELAQELIQVHIAKVNVDEHGDIAQRYQILSIPTFLIFKSGQVVDQFVGAMSKDQIKERLLKHV